MMGHKERLKSGAEYDLLYGRRNYCYMHNTSAPRKIKKQLTHRTRRKDKIELKNQSKEGTVN